MTRRDPALEAIRTSYLASLNGSAQLVPAQSGIVVVPQVFSVASLGGAGTAAFSTTDGSGIKTLAVPANGAAQCVYGAELAIGSGVNVNTSTAMSVTMTWTTVDERTPITKEQARANSYFAYEAQRAAGRLAIRTPNRFGGQVEG